MEWYSKCSALFLSSVAIRRNFYQFFAIQFRSVPYVVSRKLQIQKTPAHYFPLLKQTLHFKHVFCPRIESPCLLSLQGTAVSRPVEISPLVKPNSIHMHVRRDFFSTTRNPLHSIFHGISSIDCIAFPWQRMNLFLLFFTVLVKDAPHITN